MLFLLFLFFFQYSYGMEDFTLKKKHSLQSNSLINGENRSLSKEKRRSYFIKQEKIPSYIHHKKRASTLSSLPSEDLPKVMLRSASQAHVHKKKSSQQDSDLIKAVREQKYKSVKLFLPKSNPNEKNIFTNTPLHYAVLLKNLPITSLLLHDPRVNSLIENNNNIAPYEFICDADIVQHSKLYKKLLKRKQLDLFINALILSDREILWSREKTILQKITIITKQINSSELFSKYATNKFILKMVQARLSDDVTNIQKFFSKKEKNINTQDILGNTSLHHAIYLKDVKKAQNLVENPHVNTLIQNKEKKFAHQIISTDESKGLRLLLFIRQNLELLTQREIPTLLSANQTISKISVKKNGCATIITTVTLKKNDDVIKQAIHNIKTAFIDMKKQQEDTILPLSFPDYATKNFLFKLFITHMNYKKEKMSSFTSILRSPLPSDIEKKEQ